MFDNEQLKHLESMELRIIEQSARNTQVIMENVVNKQFQLVLEGQHDLKQTLAPKSRVEELEEQVEFLKLAIRGMVQDIAELKKAQ